MKLTRDTWEWIWLTVFAVIVGAIYFWRSG